MKIASSSTLEGLTTLINQFWLTDKYIINKENLSIQHPEKDVNDRFEIVKKKGKYTFQTKKL